MNHHKNTRNSIYNCSECETECSSAHCKKNEAWCIDHLGIEYKKNCKN